MYDCIVEFLSCDYLLFFSTLKDQASGLTDDAVHQIITVGDALKSMFNKTFVQRKYYARVRLLIMQINIDIQLLDLDLG